MEVERRHEGHHHTANIKYGYAIFGISLIAALIFTLWNYAYLNKWVKRGAPPRKSVWARIGSPEPLWLQVVLWSAILVVISFFNIHNIKEDYTTLIKRFGRLGFYLVPFDIFLAMRPSLMASSYLGYISLHKWISRLIIITVFAHGFGYLAKWTIAGDLLEKSLKTRNFLGVMVFILSLVLFIVSMRPIRRRVYDVFYLWHNVTIAAFLTLILWHARPGVLDALVISAGLVILQILRRLRNCFRIPEIAIKDSKLSTLRVISMRLPDDFPTQWQPGTHIRLSFPLTNHRYWLFPSHPFTISSLPGEKVLKLVVKKSNSFHAKLSKNYTLSNPYASLPPPFFQTAEKVVILCGGSGISFGIPVFRYLKSNASVAVELHWAISSRADTFILESDDYDDSINVYVTNSASVNHQNEEICAPDQFLLASGEQFEMGELLENSNELENRISDKEFQQSYETRIRYYTGRPLCHEVFSTFSDGDDGKNSWIVVCGPDSMISSAKKWGSDNGISVFSEYYDF